MPLPLLAGGTAAVVAGLSAFLASRAGWLLAGLGVGWTVMQGMTTLGGYVIGDMQEIIATLNAATGGSGGAGGAGHYGAIMLALAGYAGLWDAINIVLGGYMTAYGLIAMRVVLTRLGA